LQCLFVDKPVSDYEQQNPDEPWTKVAEEIEKKVSRIKSLSPNYPTSRGERHEGDELQYLCDRQQQEMAFATRFPSHPQENPQIFFLRGGDSAAHAGFPRRIRFQTLPALLDQPDESLRDLVYPVVAPWVQTAPTGTELGYLLDQLVYAVKKLSAASGRTAA